MIFPPFLAVILDLIVRLPMAFTPIILTIILILDKKFLHRISRLLNTKVVVFFIAGLMSFCVRQIFVGQSQQYWGWMIIYLTVSLFILLYTRKNKGYDNPTSFRLAVYSIWAASFLKESVWYMFSFTDWFGPLVKDAILGGGEWWMVLGFHMSCIISGFFFFLILVQMGWHPSKKWIMLIGGYFFVALFILKPFLEDPGFRYTMLAGCHRLPWIIIMLLAVVKSPKKKQKERRDKK